MGGIARPIIATATDTSAFEPDGTPRVPLGNVAEQAGYWTEKAGDTTKGYLPWNLPARWRLGNDLEALHQDLLNGSFPLNDRAKLEEWLAQRSKALTESQKNWYEAVQGKADTSTDKGLAQHIYTHANSLLNPVNAELVSKFIQTRDPEVWKELHRNLTRTPERAETEQAQQKSLDESQIVNFMTKNYGGGDYAEHMKSAGDPIEIASNLIPMVRGLRAGKAAAEAAVLAGKSTLKGSAAAIAKSAAINLGTGGVQTLVENPDATFADLAQAGKENIATALGLHAVGHVAGKAKALFTDLNDPRKARQVIDQLGAPNRKNTFKEALQLHEAEQTLAAAQKDYLEKKKSAGGTLTAEESSLLDKAHATLARHAPRDRGPLPAIPDARRTIQDLSKKEASGTRLQFSQGGSEKKTAGQAMQGIAGDEGRFRRGKASQSKDFGEITREYSLPGEVVNVYEHSPFGNESTKKVYRIDLKSGGHAYLLHGTNGKVWVDTSKVRTKDGQPAAGGDLVYQAAMTYAHNNGLKFVEDHRGVSSIARFRRISQMLSNALRHGSTEHISPSPATDADSKDATIPGWRHQQGRQDTTAYENNINQLALAEMHEVEKTMRSQAESDQERRKVLTMLRRPLPEHGPLDNVQLQDLKWNPEDDTVTHVPTGRRLSERDFEQIVSGLDPARSGIGPTTLSRALVARQALLGRVPGEDSKHDLHLEKSGGRGREGTEIHGDGLFKILKAGNPLFYSKSGSPDAGGPDGGGSGRKLAGHFGTDSRGLAQQTAQTVGTLNERVPGLLHDRTHVFHSVEDLLKSDYAKQHPFSKEDLAGLQNAEGFHDPKTGHSAIIAGNVELRPGETPHDALTRVILHERVGHDGLQTLLGSKDSKAQQHWQGLTQRIKPEELDAIARQDGYQHLAGNLQRPGPRMVCPAGGKIPAPAQAARPGARHVGGLQRPAQEGERLRERHG